MKTKEPVRPVATPPVKAPTPPAAAPSPAQPPAVAKRFFGRGLANVDLNELIGYLVTIEGTDGVGRTTQIDMLRNWLEVKGFGVIETGWTRSPLVGPAIELAKSGNALNPLTFNLLYATDLADRFEHEVVPALKS